MKLNTSLVRRLESSDELKTIGSPVAFPINFFTILEIIITFGAIFQKPNNAKKINYDSGKKSLHIRR